MLLGLGHSFRQSHALKQELLVPDEHIPSNGFFESWDDLKRSKLPKILTELPSNEEIENVYSKYKKDRSLYVKNRKFCGEIITKEQLLSLFSYCKEVQDNNIEEFESENIPFCVFYPSCGGEDRDEMIYRDQELISLLVPASLSHKGKPSDHFVINRSKLDEFGIHYNEDLLRIAEEFGVRARYFHNGRNDRLFDDLSHSLKNNFPEWMLELEPNMSVKNKYRQNSEYYPKLRHLGKVTREHLGDFFEFLKDKFSLEANPKVSSPYFYTSSADDEVISVNIPSPAERGVYINVTVPKELVGETRDFARKCLDESIAMAQAPGSNPKLGKIIYPEGGNYPASIDNLSKQYNSIDKHNLWLIFRDMDNLNILVSGISMAIYLKVLRPEDVIKFFQDSRKPNDLAMKFIKSNILYLIDTYLSKDKDLLDKINTIERNFARYSLLNLAKIFEKFRNTESEMLSDDSIISLIALSLNKIEIKNEIKKKIDILLSTIQDDQRLNREEEFLKMQNIVTNIVLKDMIESQKNQI